jgi:hypothetical protein
MKSIFGACILMSVSIVAASAEEGKTVFGYSSSGSCIASPLGFTSKLEPTNPGLSWRITFNAVGSADADGKVTEAGQSVDSASFGAGPRMHSPCSECIQGYVRGCSNGAERRWQFQHLTGDGERSVCCGAECRCALHGFDFRAQGMVWNRWNQNVWKQRVARDPNSVAFQRLKVSADLHHAYRLNFADAMNCGACAWRAYRRRPFHFGLKSGAISSGFSFLSCK